MPGLKCYTPEPLSSVRKQSLFFCFPNFHLHSMNSGLAQSSLSSLLLTGICLKLTEAAAQRPSVVGGHYHGLAMLSRDYQSWKENLVKYLSERRSISGEYSPMRVPNIMRTASRFSILSGRSHLSMRRHSRAPTDRRSILHRSTYGKPNTLGWVFLNFIRA